MGPASTPQPAPGLVVSLAQGVGPLIDEFNRFSSRPRLLAIVSPT